MLPFPLLILSGIFLAPTSHAFDPADDGAIGFEFRRRGATGVGLVNGAFLSGLSIKHHLTDQHGIQIGVGAAWGAFPYWPSLGVGLGVDYIHHPETVYDGAHVRLAWNIGMGAQGRFRPDALAFDYAVGVHFVAGFEIMLVNAPIDIAVEYRPGIVGTPGPGGLAFAFGDVSAHIRWWIRGKRHANKAELPEISPQGAEGSTPGPVPESCAEPPCAHER